MIAKIYKERNFLVLQIQLYRCFQGVLQSTDELLGKKNGDDSVYVAHQASRLS